LEKRTIRASRLLHRVRQSLPEMRSTSRLWQQFATGLRLVSKTVRRAAVVRQAVVKVAGPPRRELTRMARQPRVSIRMMLLLRPGSAAVDPLSRTAANSLHWSSLFALTIWIPSKPCWLRARTSIR